MCENKGLHDDSVMKNCENESHKSSKDLLLGAEKPEEEISLKVSYSGD